MKLHVLLHLIGDEQVRTLGIVPNFSGNVPMWLYIILLERRGVETRLPERMRIDFI